MAEKQDEREALEIGLREHEKALDQALAERDRLAEVAEEQHRVLKRLYGICLNDVPCNVHREHENDKGPCEVCAPVYEASRQALAHYESLRGGADG